MTTLKEAAQNFAPKTTKNIAELTSFPVSLELKDGQGVDNEGKPFSYKYVELNGDHFRVPGSVIAQIKELLIENPNLQNVKAKKSGAGLNTRYNVIPLS